MQQGGPFYVEHYTVNLEKNASFSGRDECERIMKRIYEEDPSYWPHGLSIDGHQNVYLVKDAATQTPVGFVGWQEFTEWPMKKVGSYSIGILPEYRGNSYATGAVSKLLQEKAAGVDEVRAYVVHENIKSHGLANKLGIKIHEKF